MNRLSYIFIGFILGSYGGSVAFIEPSKLTVIYLAGLATMGIYIVMNIRKDRQDIKDGRSSTN